MSGAETAALFAALADPLRRRMVQILAAEPARAGELARRLGLPRVNVSHHLSVLARAGLIAPGRGPAVLRPEALTPLRRYFDVALTTAAISTPRPRQWSSPVSAATQIGENWSS